MFIILIIILILYLIYAQKHEIHEGHRPYMIPMDTPFKSDFFRRREIVTKSGVVPDSFEAKFLAKFMPTDKCVTCLSHTELVRKVNNYQLDFAIIVETVLYDAFHGIRHFKGQKQSNLRFVANVFPGDVNIIAPDELPIENFSDIANLRRKVTVNVGKKHSEHHLSCRMIAKELGINQYIKYLYYIENAEIAQRYKHCEIDLIYRIGEHPSSLIKAVTKEVRSHLVGLAAVNNGNIFKIADSEKEFYLNHSSYKKSLHDLNRLVPKIYPYLTLKNQDQLYIPTVSTNFILVANDRTNQGEIVGLLNKIVDYMKLSHSKKEFYMKKMIPSSLANSKLPMETHPGAAQVYKRLNLHTDSEKSHCIFYAEGKCPPERPKLLQE